MARRNQYYTAALMMTVALTLPTAGWAENISNVLSATYTNNPEIRSQRARVRATDEEMPRARSGFRPQVGFNADITGQRTSTKPDLSGAGEDRRTTGGYSVGFVQPLFRGLRTLNAMRVADASIYAERETLRRVEQEVLLDAATAYVDVIRDRAIVRLRENNVGVLAEQLRATDDRFKVGEVTKTDVAQARARHSGAISELNLAKSALKSSRAEFEKVVGYAPNSLDSPQSIVKLLPRTFDESMQRAMEEHPIVLASLYLEMAANHQVDLVRGEMLPTINLEGGFARRFNPSSGVEESEAAEISGTLSVPLYQGGELSARVRQAKQTALQRRDEVETARKAVQAELASAWGALESTKAQIVADKTQVSANETALDGVREEEKVGQRTILDVLDAQQELLDSQVALRISERDLIVATFRLLAATGRLNAHDLGLKVAQYAPEAHYDDVKRQWIGTRVEEYDNTYDQRALVEDRYFPDHLR